MENYKVKVNNEAESKEVQELFFELGFGWHCGDIKELKNLGKPYIYAYAESKDITCGSTEFAFNNHGNKELTIPQLRDLVVLKRNDVSDFNYKSHFCDKYYVGSDLSIYIWQHEKWLIHCIQGDLKRLKSLKRTKKTGGDISVLLKPIETEMKEYSEVKEYLDPNDNYSYHKVPVMAQVSNWIEVPEGMNFAYKGEFSILFTKLEMGYRDSVIVWQRHTQPEELTFIDDKPKRENNHYFIDVSDVDEIDFYEIAKRYNVIDPAIQHILKKCLAVGGRGHKDMETDLKDIFKTAKRALEINNVDMEI